VEKILDVAADLKDARGEGSPNSDPMKRSGQKSPEKKRGKNSWT
jgi:hypothetical protein